MPSGAKKRKAARKKKEKENSIYPSTNNPQGNDDLKSRDEKGGESSSPAYREHDDHHHPFNNGSEEMEERDPSAAQPHATEDVKSVEEVHSDVKIDHVLSGKEDSVVLVERALKSEESSEGKIVIFETANESYYENGNAGATSKGESFIEKNSKDENCYSFEEAITSHEFVKSIDSSPSKMTSITESAPVEQTVNSAANSSVSSVNVVASVSELEDSDTVRLLPEKLVVHPVEVTNLTMKINEDNVPLTNKNVTTSSMEEPQPKEYDSKVLASLSASPFTKVTNGAQHIKDSETAECSENQPHVALAPNMVQKTSWLSCCGLFEALSVSNR